MTEREGAQYPDAPLGTKFTKTHKVYGTESRILVQDERGRASFRWEFPPDTISDVGSSPGPEWKVEAVGPSWAIPEEIAPYGDVMAADTARDVLQNRLARVDAEPSFRAAFLAGVRYARAKIEEEGCGGLGLPCGDCGECRACHDAGQWSGRHCGDADK